jgi:hypothetical protein
VTATDYPDHAHGNYYWTEGENVDHSHNETTVGGPWSFTYAGGSIGSYTVSGWWNGGYYTAGRSAGHSNLVNGTSYGANARHTHGVYAEGGGGAHNNLPPYLVVGLIIKVAGVQVDSGGAIQGAPGKRGSIWYLYPDAGTPPTDFFVGELDGDWCIREIDGEHFERINGVWVDQGFSNRSTAQVTSGKLGRDTTGPAIPVNTWTKVLFDAKVFDESDNITDLVNSCFVVPTTGKYFASGAICQSVAAGGTYTYSVTQFRVNGLSVPTGGPNSKATPSQSIYPAVQSYATGQVTDILDLTAGDVVELWFYCSQGGTYYSGGTTLTLTLVTAGAGPAGPQGPPGPGGAAYAVQRTWIGYPGPSNDTYTDTWTTTQDILTLSITPTVPVWWEVYGKLGLVTKVDAAYHYAIAQISLDVPDQDGISTGVHYITQHSQVQTIEGYEIKRMFRLAAGTTYTVKLSIIPSAGQWNYYRGRNQTYLEAKAWEQ